ncbi:hypothetical protein CFP56_038538 [Quercus suber]|uniref:Reverse transcriptase zinc-binding domain-containing protein n=1 Tax=Quercus suber TaxID=58331 RepID=A0AAW0LND6_QUESU
MKTTSLPFSNQGEDQLSWFSTSNGYFKLKQAYRLANWGDNNMVRQQFKGDWVWKVVTFPKIKCFLWQCCHQSIPVSRPREEKPIGECTTLLGLVGLWAEDPD